MLLQGGADVTSLRVSFHDMGGSGMLLTSALGATFHVGETIAVYDEDTAAYLAEVVEQDGDALVLRVSGDTLADS